MSLAILHSRTLCGVQALKVTIEVHLANGLPKFLIVGLPETAIKESKDRVRSAIVNSQFKFPARRITVNLAPADLPKEGSRFDLPIAVGILLANKQLKNNSVDTYEFIGEVALSGELRPVKGVLPIAIATKAAGKKLNNEELQRYVELTSFQQQWLHAAIEKLHLSARSYHRLLRVARTIADLENSTNVEQQHLAEALSYRLHH